MDSHVWRNQCDTLPRLYASLKQPICKVLYTLCPRIFQASPSAVTLRRASWNLPYSVGIDDGMLNIRVDDCNLVRVDLGRPENECERVLDEELMLLPGADLQVVHTH